MRLIERLGGAVVFCVLATSLAACSGSSKSQGQSGSDASTGGGSDEAASSGSGGESSSGSGGESSSGSGGGSSSGSGGGSSSGSGGASSSGSGGASSSGSTGGNSSSSGSDDGTTGGGGDTSNNGNTSSTTAGLVDGDPVQLADFGTAAGEALCPTIAPCCDEVLGAPVSNATCVMALGDLFGADYQSANPDNFTYDPDLAGDCIATMQELYASLECNFTVNANADEFATVSALCDNVFTGTLEPGEACASDIECATEPGEDAACDDLNLDDNYVCVVERQAAAGEDCYWTCTVEGVTSFCTGGGSGVNTRPAEQGQCYTNDGLFCGSEGVCERQVGIGGDCVTDLYCREGYCSTTTGQCMPPGGPGSECDYDSWCGAGLYCADLLCAPKLESGEDCTLDSECQSGQCEADVCADGDSGLDDLALALLCAGISGEL